MKKYAFGFIDIIIVLTIITIICLFGSNIHTPTLKTGETQTLKKQIDEQVNEIEAIRLKSIELQRNTNE